MKDEIKEILEYLKTMSWENEPDIELSREEVKLLLDYITTLQEENENLKSIIKEVRKYLVKRIKELNTNDDLDRYARLELKYILERLDKGE